MVQPFPEIKQRRRGDLRRGHDNLRLPPKLVRVAGEGEARCLHRSADLLQHREFEVSHFADERQCHMVVLRLYPTATALQIQLSGEASQLPRVILNLPERNK